MLHTSIPFSIHSVGSSPKFYVVGLKNSSIKLFTRIILNYLFTKLYQLHLRTRYYSLSLLLYVSAHSFAVIFREFTHQIKTCSNIIDYKSDKVIVYSTSLIDSQRQVADIHKYDTAQHSHVPG